MCIYFVEFILVYCWLVNTFCYFIEMQTVFFKCYCFARLIIYLARQGHIGLVCSPSRQ